MGSKRLAKAEPKFQSVFVPAEHGPGVPLASPAPSGEERKDLRAISSVTSPEEEVGRGLKNGFSSVCLPSPHLITPLLGLYLGGVQMVTSAAAAASA